MTDVLTDIPPMAPASDAASAHPAARARRVRLVVVLLVAAAGATWAIRTWLASRHVVTSDNAQVDGHITPIAPQGRRRSSSRVLVEDNQQVKEGDTLVVLDARDLAAAAGAGPRRPRLGTRAGRQREERGPGGGAAGRGAGPGRRGGGHRRGRGGGGAQGRVPTSSGTAGSPPPGSSPRSSSTRRRPRNDAAIANLEAARRQATAARSQVAASAAALKGADARLAAAQAAVGTAETPGGLHDVITAPIAGIVARRRVEPGELVQLGQALMSIVPSTDVWVTANLKETQLQKVQVGDPVEFTVDAYPRHRRFQGTVERLSPATGARFALLPPDNATRQLHQGGAARPGADRGARRRDPAHPLRPGMSVDVTITGAVARSRWPSRRSRLPHERSEAEVYRHAVPDRVRGHARQRARAGRHQHRERGHPAHDGEPRRHARGGGVGQHRLHRGQRDRPAAHTVAGSARFGRRNYYTGSIMLFTVASFFCGNAQRLEALVFWRVIQGIGGGALISTAQAILFDVFPLSERGTSTAIFGMGVMVGPTLGPTLGGWITDNYSWPWIFYINIPLGILAAYLTWSYVPEPKYKVQADPAWTGWGCSSSSSASERCRSCSSAASRRTGSSRVRSSSRRSSPCSGLIAFVWHELTTPNPMVDLRMLRRRQLAVGVVFASILGFALYSSVFALPVFLQNYLGFDAWDTGRVLLPGAIATAVTMAVMPAGWRTGSTSGR